MAVHLRIADRSEGNHRVFFPVDPCRRFEVLDMTIGTRVVGRLGSLLMLSCLMAGCGDRGRVAVREVRGVVLLNGNPMRGGGSIAFLPVNSQQGKGAGGTIDSEGRYVLSTYGDGDGCMSGTFRVVVNQSVWDEPENRGDDAEKASGQKPQIVKRVGNEEIIPAIYSHVQESPVIVEILPDGDPNVTIDLASPPSRS
ncbi:MAG: hypothetical protein C0478_10320 [Planctomyces sp.]|nr:hypothetical protein [Planctomyces sp.]